MTAFAPEGYQQQVLANLLRLRRPFVVMTNQYVFGFHAQACAPSRNMTAISGTSIFARTSGGTGLRRNCDGSRKFVRGTPKTGIFLIRSSAAEVIMGGFNTFGERQ